MLSFDRHHRNTMKKKFKTQIFIISSTFQIYQRDPTRRRRKYIVSTVTRQAENPKTNTMRWKKKKERSTYSLSENYIDGTIWSRLSSRKNASICIESMNYLRGLMKHIIILVNKGVSDLEKKGKRETQFRAHKTKERKKEKKNTDKIF